MIRTERYLRLEYAKGGRARPAVDCWGLYRLIVGETLGTWLGEFSGLEEPLAIARAALREASGGEWVPVEAGDERPLDAVLLSGLLAAGGGMHSAPIHVGCVLESGSMIDIEERGGVMVRAFRSTATLRAQAQVANRVRGIYRPAVLA